MGTKNPNNESIKQVRKGGKHVKHGENVEGFNLNYRQLSVIVPMLAEVLLGLCGRQEKRVLGNMKHGIMTSFSLLPS